MNEDQIRKTLLGEKARLEALRNDTSESGNLGDDDGDAEEYFGDEGMETLQTSMTLASIEQIEAELEEVRVALEKLDNGNYGISELSGEPIDPARLEAVPTARYTLEEQQQMESGNRMPNNRD